MFERFGMGWTVLLVTGLAVVGVCRAADPNPYADYGKAMAGVNGDPNAVEWQDDNRDLIAAATSDDVLADLVKDELSATRLLAQLRGAYSSNRGGHRVGDGRGAVPVLLLEAVAGGRSQGLGRGA